VVTNSTERRIEAAVLEIIDALGYEHYDQHFRKTPQRVAAVFKQFANHRDPKEAQQLLETQFIEKSAVTSLVMVSGIRFVSLCAHHLLPVSGAAAIAYLPDKAICGLSKLERLVHFYAEQCTVQERVTQQVADTLEEALRPLGIMVVIKAKHGCMSVRGVRNPNAVTTTSAVRGVHKDSAAARSEVLALLKG
jgi:GTP cyclohydrolase IA